MGNANLFVVKNGLAVGNTTSTKTVINNAGQWVGDPTGVIQNSYNQANSAFAQANSAYIKANSSYIHANAAYNEANTGHTIAQAAYDFANTITLSSGGSSYSIIDTDLVLNASQLNCLVDTSNGAITLTLPTNILYPGYSINFADGGGNKDVNPAYLDPNGVPINGVIENLVFNATGSHFTMVYNGSTWKVVV